MNTPTPRTDAAWSASFSPENQGGRVVDLARTLERELDALTAERDQLRDEAERTDAIYQRACEVEHELQAEVERLRRSAGIVGEALERAEARAEKQFKILNEILPARYHDVR